jgi:hypothetical protein
MFSALLRVLSQTVLYCSGLTIGPLPGAIYHKEKDNISVRNSTRAYWHLGRTVQGWPFWLLTTLGRRI